MNGYLDADSLRRQPHRGAADGVTIFGLIRYRDYRLLGMNLLAEADASLLAKLWYFTITFVPTIGSPSTRSSSPSACRLPRCLLSDERISNWTKVKAFSRLGSRGRGLSEA